MEDGDLYRMYIYISTLDASQRSKAVSDYISTVCINVMMSGINVLTFMALLEHCGLMLLSLYVYNLY